MVTTKNSSAEGSPDKYSNFSSVFLVFFFKKGNDVIKKTEAKTKKSTPTLLVVKATNPEKFGRVRPSVLSEFRKKRQKRMRARMFNNNLNEKSRTRSTVCAFARVFVICFLFSFRTENCAIGKGR